MANNLQGRPWVLDTAAATTVKAGNTFVSAITFSGYTVATHTAVIKDAKRNVILYTLVGVAGLGPVQILFSDGPTCIRDLALTTLGSGQVTVDIT